MSEFKIDVRKVTEINNHPNADKLELVKVSGLNYTIIGQLDAYKIGDLVFVFQSDSILPPEIIEYFKLTFLHKGNRVKEVKLRGVVSQALILPFSDICKFSIDANKEMLNKKIQHFLFFNEENPSLAETIDFSEELGVTKYEVPENFTQGNAKGNLPSGLEKYDLENAERYPFYFDELINQQVIISEKLEGTNFSIFLDNNNEVHVCSRNLNLKNEGGTYWENANSHGLPYRMEFIRKLVKEFGGFTEDLPMALRGEIVGSGIQGNIYNLNHQSIYFFDIKYGVNYLDFGVFKRVIDTLGLNIAPVVFAGFLSEFCHDLDDLKIKSNGISVLNNCLREGIVIRPVKEIMTKQGFTRLIFKQRSPEYLAKHD